MSSGCGPLDAADIEEEGTSDDSRKHKAEEDSPADAPVTAAPPSPGTPPLDARSARGLEEQSRLVKGIRGDEPIVARLDAEAKGAWQAQVANGC